MGFFSSLFKPAAKPAVEIDHGLGYRVVDPYRVEVLIEPKWGEACDQAADKRKPKATTKANIAKFNATAECKTESEAWAVLNVLEQMDHFCERCGEDVLWDDKKCCECGTKLWKGAKKLEMVVVHVA